MDTLVTAGQVGTAELGFLPDGRIHVVVSQSWLNSYAACPEQARANLFDGVRSPENVDTAFGKAFHAAVEALIGGESRLAALQLGFEAHAHLGTAATPAHMTTADMRQRLLDKVLAVWERQYAGHDWAVVDGVEVSNQRVAYADDRIVVELHGTADVLLPGVIVDWKTTSRKWLGWEVERYNLQSVVYTFLFERPKTIFCVLDTRKFTYQEFSVVRPPGAVAHLLADLVEPVAHTIVSTVSSRWPVKRWPATGHDWHCSPWRCANWDNCKGSHGIHWERKGD